jgi:hypothetical protein
MTSSRHNYLKMASFDRSLGIWEFEGGAFVQIVVGGDVATAEALDMVETLVALKRKELSAVDTPEGTEATVCASHLDANQELKP